MSLDRVTFNEPDNWIGPAYALGHVDEIVLSDAFVHLEMLTDDAAYLGVRNGEREVMATLCARPTTRAERRAVLAHSNDRLRDHLAALLPWSGSIWSIPVWRRPASALRQWWTARNAARAVLLVRVDEDTELTPPPTDKELPE